MKRVLVTGGCGFIGSNFIRLAHAQHPEWHITNADVLTYAANPYNLSDLESSDRYCFEKVDVADVSAVRALFDALKPDMVFHFAAESHVDRSIHGPEAFVRTNVMGTFALLEAARHTWTDTDGKLFLHVSTDEVYGTLGDTGYFTEETPYDPSSPYSASKASSDHLVRAYHRTYGLPIKLTNCSNNYGAYQFPEKLLPVMIQNAFEGKALPVYGDGKNVRDWLEVNDHCTALLAVAQKGRMGETYNIGGNSERSNLEVVEAICRGVAKYTGRTEQDLLDLISFVKDRPGHDFRYAIDASKLQRETGWSPSVSFEDGLAKTIAWYLEHQDWIETVRSGAYLQWMELNYQERDNL